MNKDKDITNITDSAGSGFSEASENPEVSIGDFIRFLWELKCRSNPFQYKNDFTQSDILHYGHYKAWLEDSDENHPEKLLDKRTAARIIHQFLKIEFNITDVPEIKEAEQLSDLYTCRVCVNHVAQVFIRGIIPAEKLPDNKETLFFNHCALVKKEEAQKMIQKIEKILHEKGVKRKNLKNASKPMSKK